MANCLKHTLKIADYENDYVLVSCDECSTTWGFERSLPADSVRIEPSDEDEEDSGEYPVL